MTDLKKTIDDLKLLNALCHGTVLDDAIEILKQRTGHWIEYPEALAYDDVFDDSFIVCSVCKHAFNIIDNCTEEFDYCPHCGAKMEEVANGNGQGEGYQGIRALQNTVY